MYLCWDKEAVYVGLYAPDFIEDIYYKDKHVPEVDRMQWSLTVNGKRPSLRIHLGAGRPPTLQGVGIGPRDVANLEQSVRNTAVVRLPAALFGKQRLQAGDTIRLVSTLLTHARAYKVEWMGEFTLASR